MTQRVLRLKGYQRPRRYVAEFAEAVGLSSDNDVVTLRFMSNSRWGQAPRQVQLDRRMAEQLSTLLNYELDVKLSS